MVRAVTLDDGVKRGVPSPGHGAYAGQGVEVGHVADR